MIAIADIELEVLKKPKLRYRVDSSVEGIILLLPQRIPLLDLLFCELRALPCFIRSSDVEDRRSISITLAELVLQEIKIA